VLVPGITSAARRVVRSARPAASWQWPRAVDILPPYVTSLALAVVAEAALPRHELVGLDPIVLPLAAVVGGFGPTSGCGAPLVAAILFHKGASAAVVIAYLVAGAARGVRAGDPTVVRGLGVCVASGVGALMAPVIDAGTIPNLHELGHQVHPIIEYVAAGALGVWVVSGIAVRGPRRWFAGG